MNSSSPTSDVPIRQQRSLSLRGLLPMASLVIVGVIWHGADRTSSGPAIGEKLCGTATQPATQPFKIRVATFNIHSGIGPDGKYDLDRTAQELRGVDLIALNEVRGPDWRGRTDQAEGLGQQLKMPWLFAPTERQWWHDHFGNGVLTSLPVSQWLRIPLPCSRGKGHRNALLLTVQTGDRPLHVLITHIDRSTDREAQLQSIAALFLSLAEPAILMGDLNSTAADPELIRLCQIPGITDTVAIHRPLESAGRIDWIITRGLRCTNSGTQDTAASDHPVVWAELELPASQKLTANACTSLSEN